MLKPIIWLSLPVCIAIAANSYADKPPKLILQITVDQLRADLPGRFLNKDSDGGFSYLYEEGVVYNNAHHNFQIPGAMRENDKNISLQLPNLTLPFHQLLLLDCVECDYRHHLHQYF